jgi:AraC-like DNA-binding protein
MLQNSEFFEFDKVRIFNVQIKKVDNNGSIKESAENDINAKYVEANNQIQEKLLTIVRNGDIEAARLLDFAKTANQLLIYRNNPFTNIKTSLMIFDALCNREALKSGVDLFLANKISNNIKFNINKISMSSEARTMAEKILSTYAKVVRDYTLMNHSSNIKKIILYIRKNLTNKISLDDIAGDLFITKEHLSRLFKKEMGLTISEYIINAKIEEAKTLLKETDYNVLDIAVLLNFANSSHFSNSFKKITGMAPSDYRKTL